MERYIGLDVHPASCTAVVMDSKGRTIGGPHLLETNGGALVEFFRVQPGEVHLCLEEGTQSQWLYEILKPHVAEIVVTVPIKTQGNKNDREDARKLADSLRTNAIKVRVFKDDGKLTALRELRRIHSMTVEDSARTQNRVRSLFRSRGVALGQTSLEDLDERAELLARLPAATREGAQVLFQQLDVIQPIRKDCEKKLVKESRNHPAIRWIASVPGIGPIRAARILAVIVTPDRFRTRRQLWAYSGLAIETRSSADWERLPNGKWQRVKSTQTRGLNRNHSRVLKDVFKGAAQTVIKSVGESPLRNDYQRCVAAGTKPNLAELTLARKIASIVLATWKHGEMYDPAKGCVRDESDDAKVGASVDSANRESRRTKKKIAPAKGRSTQKEARKARAKS